jgi:cold shock CspA family protein/tetratricopeptide (TPR) repeat protein
MLRAKVVHALFPNYTDAKAIYTSAEDILGDDTYLFQQQANYERIRPDGNLRLARTLLERAIRKEPSDSTILHTLAEVIRTQAVTSSKPLERKRFRNEASSLLRRIGTSGPSYRYAAVTQLKLALDELRDLLRDEEATDRQIDEAVRETERIFKTTRQRFPGEKHVHVEEHEFARLLNDDIRSFEALTRARVANPRDPFLASRLSSILVTRGDIDKARAYLEEALESNRGDKRLNFQFAELRRLDPEASPRELAYYYQRSFTKWDENYESQFWYARFAFESSDPSTAREAKEVFKHLREVPMSHEERIRVRDAVGGLSEPRLFAGAVVRVEAAHGFVSMDGSGDWVFFHENDVPDGMWERLSHGNRVVFSIGFSLRGPKALGLRLEGDTA